MNITNDIITAYIDTLYSSNNESLKELRSFAEKNHVPIILKDTEGLLLNLLRIKQPENILEIGAAVGYSACCFADGVNCNVTTIESDRQSFEIACSNVESMGFSDRVKVLHGDARDVMESLTEEKRNYFDVIFIDAAKSHYKTFWDLAMPLCRDDALIICDNVLMKGMTASDRYDTRKKYKTSIRKMREFISYINSLSYAKTCILPVGDGVSVSVIDKTRLES